MLRTVHTSVGLKPVQSPLRLTSAWQMPALKVIIGDIDMMASRALCQNAKRKIMKWQVSLNKWMLSVLSPELRQ